MAPTDCYQHSPITEVTTVCKEMKSDIDEIPWSEDAITILKQNDDTVEFTVSEEWFAKAKVMAMKYTNTDYESSCNKMDK